MHAVSVVYTQIIYPRFSTTAEPQPNVQAARKKKKNSKKPQPVEAANPRDQPAHMNQAMHPTANAASGRSSRKKQTTQTVQENTSAQQNSLALMPEPMQQAAAQSAELLQSASAAAFYSVHSHAQLRQPKTVMFATHAAHAAHSALSQPAVQMGAQTGVTGAHTAVMGAQTAVMGAQTAVTGAVMLGCSSEVVNAAHTGTVSNADCADLKSSDSTDAHFGKQSFRNNEASAEEEQSGAGVKPDTVQKMDTGANNGTVETASVPAATEGPAVEAAATSTMQDGNSTAVMSASQDLAVESSAGVGSRQGRKRAAESPVSAEMHVKRARKGNNNTAWNEGGNDHDERPSPCVDPMQLDSSDDDDHSMRRTVRRRARAL